MDTLQEHDVASEAHLRYLETQLNPLHSLGMYFLNNYPSFSTDHSIQLGTLERILSLESLPHEKDVHDLLFFSEMIRKFDPDAHERIFSVRHIAADQSDLGILGDLPLQHSTYHILTYEFIESLAKFLAPLPKPIVEIASGKGKLAYWLSSYGIDIIATDISPSSPHVRKLCADGALSIRPRTVITSWLDTNFSNVDEGIQHRILETPSVTDYVEIRNGCTTSMIGVDSTGDGHPLFSRHAAPTSLQRESIPIDLFCVPFYHKESFFASAMKAWRFDPKGYLGKNPTLFYWKRLIR